MSEDLDLVLVEMLQSAKTRLNRVNKLLKILPNDHEHLHYAKSLLEKNIEWYQSLITNEKMKKKKPSIKRTFNNIFYEVKFIYFKLMLTRTIKKDKHNGGSKSSNFWTIYRRTRRE